MHNHRTGVISLNSKGKGFVDIEGLEESIPVEPDDVSIALPGDTVEIETYTGFKGDTYGKVIKIVERKKLQFVGTIVKNTEAQGAQFILLPDDRRLNISIDIVGDESGQGLGGLKENLKVVAKITDWEAEDGRYAKGALLEIIGEKGDNDAEMRSIVIERGFDTGFEQEVLDEADEAAKVFSSLTPSKEEVASRRDVRGIFTCTIDPFDAKDFDDALSIRELAPEERVKDGNGADNNVHIDDSIKPGSPLPEAFYEIGVHIADVSHFVRPGTALDREARKRAFSVYLVDRTIPMLPHVLSNGQCSLNPHEDRFAFSAIFKTTKDGKILDEWFGRTIMHSDRRFTYEEVQEILDDKSQAADAAQYADRLKEMNRIAKLMLKERQKAGSIDFETTEIKFKLDETGKPIAVYKKERLDAHKLVEEYMLLANREVAEYLHAKSKNLAAKTHGHDGKASGSAQGLGVYRVHSEPDYERLQDLGIFVRALGFDFNPTKNINPRDVQSLLRQVEGSPAEAVIKIATLRSMAKATYATANTGHFGLAFDFYTQFTSPIRRYPDLMVHRILAILLEGKTVPAHMAVTLEKICLDSSRREVEAADAERASIKYKQVEYMQNKVGQILEAKVSGIADWGMYIEEPEAKAEGLIRLRDLKPDDFYTVDKKNYKVIGQNTKKEFNIGDPVKVKLIAADLDNKMLEFQLMV